jgi:hypothetical protein
MSFTFNKPKTIPAFASRSEAFDYMLSDLVAHGTDMMELPGKKAH